MTNNLFNDVQNKNLRTWNRCAVAWNVMGHDGPKAVVAYLQNFSESERDDIGAMMNRIKNDGYDTTLAAINREIQNA